MLHYPSLLALIALLVGCSAAIGQEADSLQSGSQGEKKREVTDKEKSSEKKKWNSLLPDKGLEGWEVTDFGGQGQVSRKGELLILEMGDPLTGVNYKRKDFPINNFEIELEAQRLEGNDFLCGLTFPVGDEFCSFIAGGWGGGVAGLSSVDGYDASENATSFYHSFDNGKWYRFRIAVDDEYITAWIDDRQVLEQERDRHEFSTRIEVYVSRPLGLCAYQSKVAVKNFRWRPIASSKSTNVTADAAATDQK